jgi:putative hydrolases of HD superfamily
VGYVGRDGEVARVGRDREAAPATRLSEQIGFLIEADKLKSVMRRTPLTDGSRMENSAEHSWHLALAAMTLVEYAPAGVNLGRVLELVTVHDLVEIDAGDTFAHDPAANATKAERELAAAERIFNLLPADQAMRVRALWDEFEASLTAEARFANALDRVQALCQNMQSGGGSWAAHAVTRAQVLTRMAPVEAALPEVWPFVVGVIDRFCAAGVIRP